MQGKPTQKLCKSLTTLRAGVPKSFTGKRLWALAQGAMPDLQAGVLVERHERPLREPELLTIGLLRPPAPYARGVDTLLAAPGREA